MEYVAKRFDELTAREVHEIVMTRFTVFVDGQNCPWREELDGLDPQAFHVFLRDENGIAAYLRVLDEGDGIAHIGRVLAVRRRQGLGTQVLERGIAFCRDELHARKIVIHAQCYVQAFYERAGFVVTSDVFDEVGIPHVMMELIFRQ